MRKMVEELSLPTRFPSISKILTFGLGDYVWQPSARFELDFNMNVIYFTLEKRDVCWNIFNTVFHKFLMGGTRAINRAVIVTNSSQDMVSRIHDKEENEKSPRKKRI